MVVDLMTLSATERTLVENFAIQGNDGRATEDGIKLVLDFLVDGTISFGLVGTAQEHLHAMPLDVTREQFAYWCTTCDQVVNKKGCTKC